MTTTELTTWVRAERLADCGVRRTCTAGHVEVTTPAELADLADLGCPVTACVKCEAVRS